MSDPKLNMKKPTICLSMIVRNEAHVIERCLESVRPLLDHWVIVDTGSNDGTQDVVQEYLKDIPGQIHERPWRDFAHNRTEALDLAHDQADYALIIDADDTLKIGPGFDRSKLEADAYEIEIYDSGLRYRRTQIVKNAFRWRYRGVLHEFIECATDIEPRPRPTQILSHVAMIRIHDGARQRDPLTCQRDVDVLEKAVEVETDPFLLTRYTFYLAQAYKDIQEYTKAMRWYQKRTKMGGFDEEVWYAHYMVAFCHKQLGNWQDMTFQALKAYQVRPTRAEPLLLLSEHYRSKGENALAVLMSRAGIEIPRPGDRLFVEDHVYGYGFRQEISIAGFYSPRSVDRDRAKRLCLDLATDRDVPDHVRDAAVRNSVFYAESAEKAFGSFKTIPISPKGRPREASNERPREAGRGREAAESEAEVSAPRGREAAPTATRESPLESKAEVSALQDGSYVPLNPSIVIINGSPIINLRWVNYRLPNYSTPDGIVRNKNELLLARSVERITNSSLFDIEDPSIERCALVDEISEPPLPGAFDHGFQDIRLFVWKGQLWASATVCDRHPEMRREMTLFHLEMRKPHAVVDRIRVQRTVHPELHQKNWIPFVSNGRLMFVYSSDPTIILAVDPETLEAKQISETQPPWRLSNLRGSSQAIPFTIRRPYGNEQGWLYVVHEAFPSGDSRRYTHRLVWMNARFEIEHISDPFFFLSNEIEFCAGLASHNDKILFTFGVNDASAYIGITGASNVLNWLMKRHTKETDR